MSARIFFILAIISNNKRKQLRRSESFCWDYLRVHILFLEYERAHFIRVHIENCFQQSRLEGREAESKKKKKDFSA